MRKAVALTTAMLMLTAPVAGRGAGEQAAAERFIVRQLHGSRVVLAAVASTDLNGDGRRETVAYISSPEWCGSGGCPLLIASPVGDGYRLVARTTVTRLPIRRLLTRSADWSDIGVNISGGGIVAVRPVALRFNGRRYPSNPTVDGRPIAPGGGVVLIDGISPRRVIRRS